MSMDVGKVRKLRLEECVKRIKFDLDNELDQLGDWTDWIKCPDHLFDKIIKKLEFAELLIEEVSETEF